MEVGVKPKLLCTPLYSLSPPEVTGGITTWDERHWMVYIVRICTYKDPIPAYVYTLLYDVSLRRTMKHLPVCLAVLHILQLQSEGSYVLLALQQEDPSALVQTRRLTDPHMSIIVAHTWQKS